MFRSSAQFLRLFLVRHAEAVSNVGMRYLGSSDDLLTERGTWQAAQVAEAFRPLPIAAAYASPLRRAVATATPIAEAHGLIVQLDQRLREGSFGDWEGLTRAELLTRSEEDARLLAHWEADPSCAPPGGESLLAIQERMLAFVDEAARRHAGESIVVVSHVGPIKALLCRALGVSLTAARHMFLDSATISVIDWGAHPLVRLFNAHHHLGWEAARWMSSKEQRQQ